MIPDDIFEAWENLAIKREGYDNIVYLDSNNIPTYGIGCKVMPGEDLKVGQHVDDDYITKQFRVRSEQAYAHAMQQAEELGRRSKNFIVALISANFQLGNFYIDFPTTFILLKQGHWQHAIENLLASKWDRQTPLRVDDLISAIRKEYNPPRWWRVVNYLTLGALE